MARSRFAKLPLQPSTPAFGFPPETGSDGRDSTTVRVGPATIAQSKGLIREQTFNGLLPAGPRRAAWLAAAERSLSSGLEFTIALVVISMVSLIFASEPTRAAWHVGLPILFDWTGPVLCGVGALAGIAWAIGLPLRGIEGPQGVRIFGGLGAIAGFLYRGAGLFIPTWEGLNTRLTLGQSICSGVLIFVTAAVIVWVGFHQILRVLTPQQAADRA